MNTSKRTDNHETDWQILGKLDVPVGISTKDAVGVWLAEILPPLNLSADFFDRFLKSAQSSVMRALETSGSVSLVYVHIVILVPHKYNSTRKSWGYFQIEKINVKADVVNAQEHTIDFYLYVEGN